MKPNSQFFESQHYLMERDVINDIDSNDSDKLKGSPTPIHNVEQLHNYVSKLKIDIKTVMNKIENNIEDFSQQLSTKLEVILELLSEKHLHVDSSLENCYSIIGDLIEALLNAGEKSEKDVVELSTKLHNLSTVMNNMTELAQSIRTKPDPERLKSKEILWYINKDCKLTQMRYISVGSILPKFKCGDKFERNQFITYISKIFIHYQVPEHEWIGLVANQLVESAQEWWSNIENKNSMTWPQFVKLFLDSSFKDKDEGCSRPIINTNYLSASSIKMKKKLF